MFHIFAFYFYPYGTPYAGVLLFYDKMLLAQKGLFEKERKRK